MVEQVDTFQENFLTRKMELVYALACRIIWTCPMAFKNFPMDVQV